MNFTEEEREQLEEQYQEVDEKLIQIQILMELHAIRQALTEPQEAESGPTVYTCTACGESVPAEKRSQHAANTHNAPPDVPVADLGLFAEQ
jgi:transcription initiation factor IIE alpha subunit